MSETTTWHVTGMTCGHCATSVTQELLEVDGIQSVDVELGTGEVTVVSSGPVDPAAVAAAVDEAGYALA